MTDMCNCCNAVHIRTMSAQKLSCSSLLSPMPSRQALQQEDTFFRIMKMLHHNTNVSQRMLAQQVGLSLGGAELLSETSGKQGLGQGGE